MCVKLGYSYQTCTCAQASDKKKYEDKNKKEKAVYDKKLAKYKTTASYKKYQKEKAAWKKEQKA